MRSLVLRHVERCDTWGDDGSGHGQHGNSDLTGPGLHDRLCWDSVETVREPSRAGGPGRGGRGRGAAAADGPSMYQRSKGRGEQALAGIAHPSGLRLTLFRPSVIFGEDDRFINLFARMQQVVPLVPLAGAKARFQPIWVHDVAQAVQLAVRHPQVQGRTYELGGPEVLTLADLVRHAGRWAGCQRPIMPLPHAVAWMQAALMELAPGEPLMSRDNLASMQQDNVLGHALPGLRELGLGQGHALGTVFRLPLAT